MGNKKSSPVYNYNNFSSYNIKAGGSKNSPEGFSMGGFSGFGEGTGSSPITAADAELIAAAGSMGDAATESTRQMGETINKTLLAIAGKDKDEDKNEDENEDEDEG